MQKHLLLIAVLVLSPAAALAGEIVQCAVPDDVHVETPDFTYCDIYERQLAYKTKRDALQEELEARQKAFAEPGRRAKDQYRANLHKTYDREARKTAGGNT